VAARLAYPGLRRGELTLSGRVGTLVEIFNNGRRIEMATVNFSVPEDIKDAFNKTFAGRNKSAIVAELMKRAVEEEKQRKRQARAIDRLVARRESKQPVSTDAFHGARESLRK